MSLSTPFIRRPVATTLLILALLLVGTLSFGLLPAVPPPNVNFPAIVVSANLPGANPETMTSLVAMSLEHSLGRIVGISEMISGNPLSSTTVVLVFDLEKDIDGAAREAQVTISGVMSLLPDGMPNDPSYRKVNPSSMPITVLTLTSETQSRGEMYDLVSTVLAPKLSQVQGMGQVNINDSSLLVVRANLNPDAMSQYGLSSDGVRTAIAAANGNGPKSAAEKGGKHWQVDTNDQLRKTREYKPLVIHYNTDNDAAVRLGDVVKVSDLVKDVRSAGSSDNLPAVLLIITRQLGADIIKATDAIHARLPVLQELLGPQAKLDVTDNHSPSIHASLEEVELILLISVAPVILVALLFLHNSCTTLIPNPTVPVSLIGTFAVMYLCDFSSNNLSLVALIIAAGSVADDTIVVVESIARRIEEGDSPIQAVITGACRVDFIMLSMTLSLVTMFIPLLLMGGLTGRLLHEFTVALSAAILVSLVISLTLMPMLCACLLHPLKRSEGVSLARCSDRFFAAFILRYRADLGWVLEHSRLMVVIMLTCIAMNLQLLAAAPKGFPPQQDSGRLRDYTAVDQSVSFQSLSAKMGEYRKTFSSNPAVGDVAGFAGGSHWQSSDTDSFFITLKPTGERDPVEKVLARLRERITKVPGATFYLNADQDVHPGGRDGNAQYEPTLCSDDLTLLREWASKAKAAMHELPQLVGVNSDSQDKGTQIHLVIDHDRAAALRIDVEMVDTMLNDSFGQRQVSTIFNPLNQYRVVMEVNRQYQQSLEILRQIQVIGNNGQRVPLSAFSHYGPSRAPLGANHQSQFAVITLSFNLAPGAQIGPTREAIMQAPEPLRIPVDVWTNLEGSTGAVQDTQNQMPWLILLALLAVYIVLGVLYKSYVYPLTILPTLPSAGVGMLFMLTLCRSGLSLIALISIIPLIGIVKKNAIMMIGFALEVECNHGPSPREAILEACMMRLRPIMMTTLAALLGTSPLTFGIGGDATLRRSLGIIIAGGLIGSRLPILYTTPVVYFYLDCLCHWVNQKRGVRTDGALETPL